MSDTDWQINASCAEAPIEDFYPIHGFFSSLFVERTRTMYCNSCPVRLECLAYAIAHRDWVGLYGGMSPEQRKRIPTEVRMKIRRLWFKKYHMVPV